MKPGVMKTPVWRNMSSLCASAERPLLMLSVSEDRIRLHCRGDNLEEAAVELPAEWHVKPFSAAYNHIYLSEALSSLKCAEAVMRFSAETAPVLITKKGVPAEEYASILMPLTTPDH